MRFASLLTPKELAAACGASVPTVLDWYHKGRIPAEIAEGAVYRFDLQAVNEALESRMKAVSAFYQRREEDLKSGVKAWNLASPIEFKERLDAGIAFQRRKETAEAAATKGVEIPNVPIQTGWMSHRLHSGNGLCRSRDKRWRYW